MKKLLLLCIACFLTHIYAQAGFTNVVNTGTNVTATVEGNWGEVMNNVKDDNPSTKYTCFFNAGDSKYIQYELASPAIIYKYSITNADYQPRDPKAWKLQGSTNGSDWVELDAQSDITFSGPKNKHEYVLRGNNTAYKFYQLVLLAKITTADQISLADWNLYEKDSPNTVATTLKIAGSALAESSSEIIMGWKGGYYELYTSLKSGNYAFEGDNSIAGATLTTENDEAKPYRIRVDYRDETPVVTFQKIEKVDLWTPWGQYVIGEMSYIGNSMFSLSNRLYNNGAWGDPRYRIRIHFETGEYETYGGRVTGTFSLTLTHNGQWGESNGKNEWSFDLPTKYRDAVTAFDVKLNLNSSSVYTHTISDYTPTVLPTSLSMGGTALVEAQQATPLLMKQDGSIFELYTALSSGSYSFVGDDNLSASSIVVDGTAVPYRIRVNYAGETPSVTFEKIESVYIWVPWSQNTVGTLAYEGNSTFKAPNLTCNTVDWSNTDWEDRHRIRIKFEGDVIETYGPKDGVNFVSVGNNTWGTSDFNYTIDAKYKNTNTPFSAIVELSATTGYQYSVEDYITVGIDEINNIAPMIYPTLVSDRLTISLPKAGFRAEILSTTGKLISDYICNSNELTIEGLNLPSGVYLVKVVQEGETISVGRIISKN